MDWTRIAAMFHGPASGGSRRAALARLAAAVAAFAGGAAPVESHRDRGRAARAGNPARSGASAAAGRRCRSKKDCPSRSCNTRAGRCRCSVLGKKCLKPSDCCSGLQCQSGVCGQVQTPSCGASTCPNGCCRNGACLPGNTPEACGVGGGACGACTGSVAPVCRNGACAARSWTRVGVIGTGTEGSADNQFKRTRGVVLSPDGLTAWIADGMNHRISIWSRPNAQSTAWTPLARFGTSADLSAPAGLALSPDTLTLWVCDVGNDHISVWTRPSAASTAWALATTFGAGRLSNPLDIVLSPDTLTAFVADTGNVRIAVWTRPNAASTAWALHSAFTETNVVTGFLSTPYGISVSPDSRTAWIADWINNKVSIWSRPDASSRAWSHVMNLGSFEAEGGDLFRPSDIIVSADTLTVWVLAQSGQHVTIWTRPNPGSLEWTLVDASAGNRYIPIAGLADALALSGDERTMLVCETFSNRVAVFSQT